MKPLKENLKSFRTRENVCKMLFHIRVFLVSFKVSNYSELRELYMEIFKS